jgi:hypothetical protein
LLLEILRLPEVTQSRTRILSEEPLRLTLMPLQIILIHNILKFILYSNAVLFFERLL